MRPDGGISLATQEDTARATEAQRSEDVVFARDYAAIVEALRIEHQRRARLVSPVSHVGPTMAARLGTMAQYDEAMSFEVHFMTFVDLHGFPALLRALARAIELETGK